MSWIGWCIIFAAVYAGYLLLRAGIDAFQWLIDVFVREPREQEKLRKLARQRRKKALAGGRPGAQPGIANAAPPTPRIPRQMP